MTDKRQAFVDELQALLRKYNAELTADDHFTGYAECGEDVRMTVEFNRTPDDDTWYDDVDLGKWFDADTKVDLDA